MTPRPPRPIAERLAANVDTSAGPDACHPWTGTTDRDGYGTLAVKIGPGRTGWAPRRAHRLAYIEANGPLPADVLVRHTCDNPPCGNLRHLRAGTHGDNMADRAAAGHYPTNEGCPNTIYPDDVVARIRTDAAAGRSAASLSLAYGISDSHVRRIIARQARP